MATHTPHLRTRRASRRLPRLGWWWATLAVVILGIAKTWPAPTAAAAVLTSAALITYVIRPRRLTRLWNGLDTLQDRRRALPHPGNRTLDTFHRMTPAQFEQAIAELALEHPTVTTATPTGGANDRGADVLVTLDNGRRILIQCKRYAPGSNVGSDTVQTINGVYRDIHHCHAAVIVTTAGYTRAALDTNLLLPQRIRLIDGHGLTTWANGGPAPWQ
ncbi:restriction endonuclease [Streptomyces sp. NPDC059582]|uniref:restriction endonuclease n=1 Tax=Streptomyces sp. NPDC059582 TaxID=3346875 RepID=UPI003679A858